MRNDLSGSVGPMVQPGWIRSMAGTLVSLPWLPSVRAGLRASGRP